MKPDSAARAVARAMGWAGARGGWIYDADRQPLAAGWHALADRLEARAWIVDRGAWLGFKVDWQRIPAPGTVRPRADSPLEPVKGGPPHPDGPGPGPTVRARPGRQPTRSQPRPVLVPLIDCESMPIEDAALATIAAYRTAIRNGDDPGGAEDDDAEELADRLESSTGIRWAVTRPTPPKR